MWWIKSILVRGKYRWRGLADRAYAWGGKWCEECWRLPRAEQRVRQLKRLRGLVAEFRAAGLCAAEGYREFDEDAAGSNLECIPVLEKPGLRELLPKLKEAYGGRRGVYVNSTGGSTGEPVHYLRSARQDACGAGASHAMQRLLGWRPGMARISLWGSERDIGRVEEKSKGLLDRLLRDTFLVGGYGSGDHEFREFVDAVSRHRGCAAYGFTSLLEACARTVLDNGWEVSPGAVGAAWVGAERLTDDQRELFRQAFHVRLRDHYGSRECSSIAAECEYGTRHVNPRYIVEALDQGSHRPPAAGEDGVLLVTDLFNDVTPLIRYKIGDLGSVDWCECACGRRGQRLVTLTGRLAEMFTLPSGKTVSSLYFNHLLKQYEGVHQFQVLRLADAEFEIQYTGEALSEADHTEVLQVARRFMEGASVGVKLMAGLERSPSGKLIQYRDLRPGS